MEIMFKLTLTFLIITIIMLYFADFVYKSEDESIKKITESDYYELVGGSFVVLTAFSAFIWVLMLIWG